MQHLPLSISEAIKESRGRVSIRELSRRSGISAGQISRIESGETERPEMDTLIALASALGGSPAPLFRLAGYEGEAIDAEIAKVRDRFEDSTETLDAISDHLGDLEGEEQEREMAWVLFEASRRVRPEYWLGEIASDETADAMAEIMRAWPAITHERRKLVRAFVADQEVLSALDRLPTSRGRYAISIELEETAE